MRHHHRSKSFLLICLTLCISLLSGADRLLAGEPATGQLDQVILVFKTHFDIGYTDMASKVIERYRTSMIDQALEVCDRNRDLPADQQFVWTLPGWPMSQIMADWPGQTAQRKQRIEQALKDGRFVVHGLPFTTHTELLEPEDLVRGLGFASQVSRAASIQLPRDAKMTDVPCHSWIMPTLLCHAGIDFLHLGCNAGSRSPQVPLLFWWEGPDGSRLLTMYVAEGYGTGLLPPENWSHRTWLALIHTGDNHGPPKPEEVSQLLAELKSKLPGVKARIGRLSDFADAILAEYPELPVVRGDMPDSWIHGPMCNPQGAGLARTVRPQMATTESLNTLLRLWGISVDDVAPTVTAAYEKSLLYGEHTWGGALYWVSQYEGDKALSYGDEWQRHRKEGKYERLEASWAEHTAYIEAARDLIEPQLQRQLQTLAQSVAVPGQRVVVYNPLPWTRDGLVSLPWNGQAPPALRGVDDNITVPVRALQGRLEFVARGVPGMGYRTYVAADSSGSDTPLVCDADHHTIAGSRFRVTIDPVRGAVGALVDTQSGRDWVDSAAPQALGQYLYERFDRDQVAAYVKAYVKIDTAWAINELGKPNLPPAADAPYQGLSPADFHVRYETSPIAATAVMESSPSADIKHGITTRISVYRDLPYVDIETTVHDKPADPWPEAGWLCLPVHAVTPQFRLGRLGSIVDPARDLVPGANHNLFGLNTGLAVVDQGGEGLGICALDSPLVSLEAPGCWKYDPQFVPRKPYVYVNLFNNQWTTNFRLWNEGSWTSRVRIWSLDKDRLDQSMVVPSLEARYRLEAAATDGPAGSLPAAREGMRVSRPGVLVTALGSNPDGAGTLLRLWDLTGQAGPCTVHLPPDSGVRQFHQVNLRGEPIEQVFDQANNTLTFPLAPFTPVSLTIGAGARNLP